ncbi:Protein kinase cGMP-dependent type I, partial [Paragonimus heterotremus]
SYNLLIGDLASLERQYSDAKFRQNAQVKLRQEFLNFQLTDFKPIGTLGAGGFGRVELVQLKQDPKRSFALKRMKKCHIVLTRQQEHVLNERNILFETNCDFIV